MGTRDGRGASEKKCAKETNERKLERGDSDRESVCAGVKRVQ